MPNKMKGHEGKNIPPMVACSKCRGAWDDEHRDLSQCPRAAETRAITHGHLIKPYSITRKREREMRALLNKRADSVMYLLGGFCLGFLVGLSVMASAMGGSA